MRLGSLLQGMNIDLDSIKAGVPTYNNMLWNNHVQGSTGDGTTLYNARNFNTIAALLTDKPPAEPSSLLPALAYGEKPDPANHAGPMFNPLHPVVQKAILGFLTELGKRYTKHSAFKGISFNMFASSMPWFGSIHSGYDDFAIRLFAQETGIAVPVDVKAPDRFSRRYEYLTFACRPAWIHWRCRKVRQLFGAVHRSLAAIRPDLRLTATLWDETTVPGVLSFPASRTSTRCAAEHAAVLSGGRHRRGPVPEGTGTRARPRHGQSAGSRRPRFSAGRGRESAHRGSDHVSPLQLSGSRNAGCGSRP